MKRLYIIFGSIALLLLMQTLMSMGSLAKPIEIASLDGISQSLDGELGSTVSGAFDGLKRFYSFTGFANATSGNLVMILIGIIFIYLGIKYDYEPLLLIPIGAGVIIGNVPFVPGNQTGIYESGSVLNYLYFGVVKGNLPSPDLFGDRRHDRFLLPHRQPETYAARSCSANRGICYFYRGPLPGL